MLAADHTKIGGEAAVARCLDLARVDVLVTDLDPSDNRLTPYRKAVDVR